VSPLPSQLVKEELSCDFLSIRSCIPVFLVPVSATPPCTPDSIFTDSISSPQAHGLNRLPLERRAKHLIQHKEQHQTMRLMMHGHATNGNAQCSY